MPRKSFFPTFKNWLISFLLVLAIFAQNSHADVLDKVRDTTVDSDYNCDTKDIKFNPMDIVNGNDDINWELTNPTCVAYVAASGAAILAAVNVSSYFCRNAGAAVKQARSTAAGKPLFPQMVKDRIKESTACAGYTTGCALSGGTDVEECAAASTCCAGAAVTAATVATAVGALGVIYGFAVDSQRHAHICGDKWNVWQQRYRKQTGPDDTVGIPDYPGDEKMYVYGKYDGSYQKKLEDDYNSGAMVRSIANQEYREYIYGGKEFKDNGSGSCKNPSGWDSETRKTILGYDDDAQRYYMRGPNLTANYACTRFLLTKDRESSKDAYECCKQRSQETLCIEKGSDYQFCKLGERCEVDSVWYEIYGSKKVPNYICAETYSVCPYNHKLGGGTEIADYDEKYPAILNNHCQYLKHCAKIPTVPYIRTSNLDGGWISAACRDLKGDSQNNYGYTADLVPINTKNFSAPIVQCVKETLENMFINRAGATICNDPDETPNSSDQCVRSGNKYTKGETIQTEQSFFQTLQDKLRFSIKVVMTMAVTVMGIGVLLTGTPADRKTVIMFVIKLGLVAYFALGDAWQSGFFSGVSTSSVALADVFMQIDESQADNKKDGCQFPKYQYDWVQGMDGTKYDYPSYPPGKSYLRIWDILDCKIARALGFGPEASVPNLIYMSLAGLLSANLGFLGLVFFVATFIFAFYLIALVVRALHIFLISSMAITLMVFVSPITITACLFKRTNGIFASWWKQLLSYVLQPVLLFAYLGILITIFEGTIIGDATFVGDGKDAPKRIDCSSGDAENNSIYCIFRIANIKTNNALAPIGVGLPILVNMNQEKVATIMKSAFIMFIFTKFFDAFVGSLMDKLTGGAKLVSESKGGMQALGKAFGVANAMRTRLTRGFKKQGTAIAKRAGGYAKDKVNKIGRVLGKDRNGGAKRPPATANDVGSTNTSTDNNPKP